MMFAVRAFSCLAGLSILAGCSDPTGPFFRFGDGNLVLDVRDEVKIPNLPADPVTITAAALDGHELVLTVQIQGCSAADHGFGLVSGKQFGESSPLFTVFRLTHRAPRGSTCAVVRAVVLRIDLRPIRPFVDSAGGPSALRFSLLEPGEHPAAVGALVYSW